MKVLLTGGAGYIGSHVVRAVRGAGHTPIVYDNLSKGHAESLEADLIVADVSDGAALRVALEENEIDAVIHFAAFIEAGESVGEPGRYFRNNTVAGLTLLEAMRETNVKRLVFSSTAAVYGQPPVVPIEEDSPLVPINPYGSSKLCVEYMLRAYAQAYGMGFVALRYFNVAGADPAGDIGEDHTPETHLIPLVLQVPLGKREHITIFGQDYDTPDGTCIRDYIHVSDLADAHVLAAGAIEPGMVKVYNLGNGEGFSVKQVIETCRTVTGHSIPVVIGSRRAGDPARLVASSARAMRELGWRTKFPRLEEIVTHAWRWHSNHPSGYA
ncbi:MAG: UDP-glucose 4-epimerase GalE [Planctomycetes bacterium]|jgi:UDP-glucose 4-epimerase|nr:UDP-glucose 4-epimerase GalE [Planctomycetota bacterium]